MNSPATLAAPAGAANTPSRRNIAGADIDATSLRDEARIVLTVAGAPAILILPTAALVAAAVPQAFAAFALMTTTHWVINAIVQVAVLRMTRRLRDGQRVPLWLQFVCVAAAGLLLTLFFDPIIGPFTNRAGLGSDDSWRYTVGAWTSVLAAVYLVWEREGRSRHAIASRRLFEIQQAQQRERRFLVDAQLRAMQARVDPQFFFDTLDSIEALYLHDPARAEALFDELIVFLRAALPHVDAVSSDLAREIDLAASSLRIRSLASGHEWRLDVDVPSELTRVPFPPGVLLPLIRGALDASKGGATIGFRGDLTTEPGPPCFRLTVIAPAATSAMVYEPVRDSLAALFGRSASLAIETHESGRTDITVSIPYDDR